MEQPSPPARLPPGRRLYVIGDIHGTLDLLDDILIRIENDLVARPPKGTIGVIGLGDYVDRGPSSAGVLARLAEFEPDGFDVIFLKGNHELMLLQFLDDPVAAWPGWSNCGGEQTLRSYGVEPPDFRADAKALRAASARLAKALPDEVALWLRTLGLSHREGDYLFVHAGIRPGVELDDQRENDLLWIRDIFLNHDKSFGPMVVHGHTPASEPVVKFNRIGIDTMAFSSQILTCLVLEGEERLVMRTYKDGIHPL